MRPETELNIDPSMGQTPETEPEEIHPGTAEVEDEQPGNEEENSAEKLLRVKLRNGKEYTGKTERELLQQIAEDNERLSADAATRTSQRDEARGKIRYQEDHKPPEGWNPQKYLDLLGTDPMEARRYQDRFYYGLDEDEDPAAAFRFSYHMTDKIADSLEVADFHRAMKGADGKKLDLSEQDSARLLDEIDREGLQLTARNLTAVYHELVSRKVIVPNAGPSNAQYEDIELTPARQESRGRNAPKTTGGGARTTTVTMKNYEGMTMKQLQEEARKQGLLQH